jgi:hypothetical protein
VQFQVARRTAGLHQMHDVSLGRAKNPGKHVGEVNPALRGNASRFLFIPFPGVKIPAATARNVGQLDIVDFIAGAGINSLLEFLDFRVKPQLKD